MRRSHIDNMTWSFLSSSQWPELDQKNQAKHSVRKKDLSLRESDRIINLDELEYPELGEASTRSRNSIVPKKYCLSNPYIKIIVPMESNAEPKQSKTVKRYRRTDKICINLQEALQNTRCVNKICNKDLPRLKINLYKGNLGIISPGITDRNKDSDLRKVRVCILKDKKPSKLKKIILLNRNIKAQINIQKRDFERAKMEAVCKDVDTLNFNSLKITTDPDTDPNYVRRMCTMTLYDKDYRDKNTNDVFESCIYYRPDIIEQINNLHIQGRQLPNRLLGNTDRQDLPRFDTNVIENDIVPQTLSFELNDDIKEEIKQENVSVKVEDTNLIKYSRSFRDLLPTITSIATINLNDGKPVSILTLGICSSCRYCTNMLIKSLNESLEQFLREICRFQKRFHEKYPNKSKYKRRYYAGLKEVRKQIDLNKIKFVIIAPDLEKVDLEGGLDDQIDKLLDACRKQNVVYCFGLRRRKLGYYIHGRGLVGCIGIANYFGTEVLFKNVLLELVQARNAFKQLSGTPETTIDISKVLPEDYLPFESVNALLKALSPLSPYS
ncbi:uncharacterized protein LOC100880499 isoform X2 [Megachile rotundata]|uniref:uncharacterized protein LOC100880499 isoform X2 n=1 Tax=Megachile rotundata TaxID=143995 RepID=UPI003FD19738